MLIPIHCRGVKRKIRGIIPSLLRCVLLNLYPYSSIYTVAPDAAFYGVFRPGKKTMIEDIS
jgi:hypothetical protein